MKASIDSDRSLIRPGRRIALVISSFAPPAGGAERLVIALGNELTKKGCLVSLLTFDAGPGDSAYALDSSVKHIALVRPAEPHSLRQRCQRILRRIQEVRRGVKEARAEVVIAALDLMNILTLIAVLGLKIPVVVWEGVRPADFQLGWGWRILRLLLYPLAQRVVLLQEEHRADFPAYLHSKCRVISNFASVPDPAGAGPVSRPPGGGRTLISLGRLVPQKQFDLLVGVFGRLAPLFPEWRLVIWGEGPDRRKLEQLILDLNLEDRVLLPGFTLAPYEELQTADVFVCSSRFEGFSLALIEALACGLPVVSFNCQSNLTGLIRDGENGIVVPLNDAAALSAALSKVMNDEALRGRLGMEAQKVKGSFNLENFLRKWEVLLAEVLPD